MSKLSDDKLNKLNAMSQQGGFWYITKQNLDFRDLCFIAKLLDVWNNRRDENYESFFDRNKKLPEYGNLPQLTAHRATKNCEYIGLTRPSANYSALSLTPFYFSLRDFCKGNFDNLKTCPQIVDRQLERIFIDSNSNSLYTNQFQICPFMFIFKILLLIGDITGSYKISTSEFKLFVATAQKWNDYFEVVESILRYRNDDDYRKKSDANNSKVADVRYNILAQNHSQLEVTRNDLAIKEGEVKSLRRKVAEYELNETIQNKDDMYTAVSLSRSSLQQIFFGAPGTGKSHDVKKQTGELSATGEERDLPNVFRTTFHPDTDYASFVGCYKPSMRKTGKKHQVDGKDVDDEEIIYEFIPQTFTDAYVYAYNNPAEPTYLVIEEINRGNCAQIFGDLFQLLDRKNGVSEYRIKADKDLAKYLNEELGKDADGIKDGKLRLPANLNILATMNTSDQSLFPIDSAFKRRWEWKYTPIAQGKDEHGNLMKWQIEGQGENSWWTFIQGINEVIEVTTHSEDKKLGFFFCKDQDGVIKKESFVNKVVFYLWNDVFKVYGFKSEIFDKKGKDDKTEKITFKSFYKDDGSVNEETISVFVKNVMAKAPKENSNDVTNESEEISEESGTEA